jgi:ribokinase
MNKRITVIGSTNVDFLMKLSHLPAVGETVTEGEFHQTYGGKGANQAVAAARAGGDVTFVTGLGDDQYAPILLGNFRKDGMHTEHIVTFPGVSCGSALIMLNPQGENYLAVAPGANYALTPAHITECSDLIQASAMVVMQMELPADTTLRALELAGAVGIPVLFNYAPVKALEIPITRALTGLVVNEVEAEALTGFSVRNVEEAQTAAEHLRGRGSQFVIVTLGAAGAVIVSEAGSTSVPAFQVTPVDTTAAGDTFCGSLAVALVEGHPLPEAVRFASAASAISVTRLGAQPSCPYREEIETFLREKTR